MPFTYHYNAAYTGGNYMTAEEVAARKQSILNQADSAIQSLNQLCESGQANISEAKKEVLQKLSDYLSARKTQIGFFSEPDDLDQIKKRSLFLNELTNAISQNKTNIENDLLSEEKIKSFKGVFTKRLYSLLSELREVIAQESHQFEVEEGEHYSNSPKL